MYEIKYLPIAKQDLENVLDYIIKVLEAPQAALNLLNDIEKAILTLRNNPYSHRLYHPDEPIDTEYRIISVKNYLIFYVVLDNVAEIHRIIYNKRDLSQLVK